MSRLRTLALVPVLFALANCSGNAPARSLEPSAPSAGVSSAATQSPQPVARQLADPRSFDPHNPVVPGFVPRAVLFVDDAHGVLGGRIECPKRCDAQHDGILAVTNDAGATWRPTARTDDPITHLTNNPSTGAIWATASKCAYFFYDCGHTLLRSVDGGRSWVDRPSWVVNPSFASARIGFGAGRLDASATTRDGGKTWTTKQGPCRGYEDMPVAFSFPTEDLGWVACASSEPGAGFFQFKAVYQTIDGGVTWTPQFMSDLDHRVGSGLGANGGALDMQMFADGSGYFWTGGGYAYLTHTVDGGRTWRTVWKDGGGGGQELTDISWTDESHAYAVRWDSSYGWTLVRTSDDGVHWVTIRKWPSKE